MTAPGPDRAAYDGPIAPEDAALCALASEWERQAFRMPWLLGEKDPRAKTLEDCATALRRTVVRLFRGDDFVQNRHADLDPNADEAGDR